jgi:hypothetical protein
VRAGPDGTVQEVRRPGLGGGALTVGEVLPVDPTRLFKQQRRVHVVHGHFWPRLSAAERSCLRMESGAARARARRVYLVLVDSLPALKQEALVVFEREGLCAPGGRDALACSTTNALARERLPRR